MQWCHAALHHCRADHQEPVAVQRIFFGTQQGDRLVLQESKETVECLFEVRRVAPGCVIHQPVRTVVAGVQRPAAKLITEKLVDDFGAGQLGHQGLAIELREAKTAGAAADVADQLNFMSDQRSQKNRHFEIAMADGEERMGGLRGLVHWQAHCSALRAAGLSASGRLSLFSWGLCGAGEGSECGNRATELCYQRMTACFPEFLDESAVIPERAMLLSGKA